MCEEFVGRECKSIPILLIQLRFLDPLVFGASVLEPDLDLRLGESKRGRELEPTSPRDVLSSSVLDFQSKGLFAAECRPLSSRSALFSPSTCHYKRKKDLRFVVILM